MNNMYKEVTETEEKEFLPISKVAKLFGVTKETIRKWDEQGKLKPDLRVGKRKDRRYLVKTVKRYFAKLSE